ncbi:TPA: hypothetical protein DIV55_03275 [Patescibacteria group bacterium]|uniref:Methyltransferase type 11 domain-containing protein n=1 Tax=Candidatus Gottesmanbacteria bacterium GW2011_GWA1_43_11 TaxID=1618436 RepID=A0A0G1EM51_9BACT|nr:MAG: hypothetical protein UV59_C0027G0034 [Candidatus Gottesmanbacteria bacterium GW2011_GWA1_43_11]HCS78740.1 hypothetical protein [Patescibacteria group bacterium]
MAASPEIFRAQPLENGDSSLPVVQRRVLPIYRLTTQFMKPDCEMLDIGTYDGFGVVELLNSAEGKVKHLTSIDIDPKMLARALSRSEINQELEQKGLHLVQMDARNLALPNNCIDLVTLIEVIGVGLENSDDPLADWRKILNESARVLKNDGTLIFTFRDILDSYPDETIEWDTFSANDGGLKGIPLNKGALEQDIGAIFEEVMWYGQILMERDGRVPGRIYYKEDNVIHTFWNSQAFIPIEKTQIDVWEKRLGANYFPLFWIGIAKYPRK